MKFLYTMVNTRWAALRGQKSYKKSWNCPPARQADLRDKIRSIYCKNIIQDYNTDSDWKNITLPKLMLQKSPPQAPIFPVRF